MNKTVMAFGEVLWDILPSCVILGGAPFNFAYRINSLGDTARIVSRLGRDDLGRKAFDKIVSLGLDTTLLQWDDDAPTGTVQVSFDAQNHPDYVIVPNVAYDRIGFTPALGEAAERADCLCFGTLAQRASPSRAALRILVERARKAVLFLDINLRNACYDQDSVTFSFQHAHVLKLNEDEVHVLGEMLGIHHGTIIEFCETILERWAPRLCLITLGSKGAFGMAVGGEKTYVPGYKIRVQDSVGSGDAFSAGFMHKFLSGASLDEAVAFGNVLGAIVATQAGATTPIAQSDIDEFLNRRLERNMRPEFEKYWPGRSEVYGI